VVQLSATQKGETLVCHFDNGATWIIIVNMRTDLATDHQIATHGARVDGLSNALQAKTNDKIRWPPPTANETFHHGQVMSGCR
jgi:hypothetical protein